MSLELGGGGAILLSVLGIYHGNLFQEGALVNVRNVVEVNCSARGVSIEIQDQCKRPTKVKYTERICIKDTADSFLPPPILTELADIFPLPYFNIPEQH